MPQTKEVNLKPEVLRKKLNKEYDSPDVTIHMNQANEIVKVDRVLTNPAYYMKKYGCYHLFNLTKAERNEIIEEKSLKELARLSL